MWFVDAARSWTLTRVVLALVLVAAGAAIGHALARLILPTGHPAAAVVVVAFVHVGYVIYVRYLEGRRAAELELEESPRGIALGFGLGVLLMLSTVAGSALAGAYQARVYRGFGSFADAAAMALFVAYAEEIVFRGVLFRILEEAVGTWISLIGSAVLFGLMHWSNPGATAWTTAAISLEAGVLLAAAYVLSRNLWVPIGLHFGWNLVQGGVLGLNVSGVGAGGVFEMKLDGPVWLTGGRFGPEASVVAVILCTAAAAGMLIVASHRCMIMRPRWRRATAPV